MATNTKTKISESDLKNPPQFQLHGQPVRLTDRQWMKCHKKRAQDPQAAALLDLAIQGASLHENSYDVPAALEAARAIQKARRLATKRGIHTPEVDFDSFFAIDLYTACVKASETLWGSKHEASAYIAYKMLDADWISTVAQAAEFGYFMPLKTQLDIANDGMVEIYQLGQAAP